jgi:hypothetical protein
MRGEDGMIPAIHKKMEKKNRCTTARISDTHLLPNIYLVARYTTPALIPPKTNNTIFP